MSIHKKVALIKKELASTTIPKTGMNRHLNFKYHELADFLPHVIRLNEAHGINDVITMDTTTATLTLYNNDGDDTIQYSIPFVMADMQAKNDAIQKLGAAITYIRRYLYTIAYGITENDAVDAQPPKPKADPKLDAKKLYAHALEHFGNDKELTEKALKEFLKKGYKADSLATFDFVKHPLKDVLDSFDDYVDLSNRAQEQMEDLGV